MRRNKLLLGILLLLTISLVVLVRLGTSFSDGSVLRSSRVPFFGISNSSTSIAPFTFHNGNLAQDKVIYQESASEKHTSNNGGPAGSPTNSETERRVVRQVEFCDFNKLNGASNFTVFRVEEPQGYIDFVYKTVPEKYLREGWGCESACKIDLLVRARCSMRCYCTILLSAKGLKQAFV